MEINIDSDVAKILIVTVAIVIGIRSILYYRARFRITNHSNTKVDIGVDDRTSEKEPCNCESGRKGILSKESKPRLTRKSPEISLD
jgi:hypothetical protein